MSLAQFARRLIPGTVKSAVASVIAGRSFGRLIHRVAGQTLRHRGLRFIIDHPRINDVMIARMFWRIYERAEADHIVRYLDSRLDVIELGASSGVLTALIASKLGPGKRVLAVEADPELCVLARSNLVLNGLDNRVEVRHSAISYGNEPVRLLRRGETAVDGRIDERPSSALTGANPANFFKAPAVTLGGLRHDYQFDDYALVCDIEGAEVEVFTRPEELVGCRLILAELHPTQNAGRSVSVDDLLSMAKEAGFGLQARYGPCVVLSKR